jgi:GST-like protein
VSFDCAAAATVDGACPAEASARRRTASDEISIADFCTLPWVFRHDWQKIDLGEFPNVKRWYDNLMARPALARGMELP